MARPIVIEFAAKTRDFLRGTKDVERATDDISDALKDAADDAERFEREFTDSMKDAERSAKDSARDTERSWDGVDQQLGEVGAESGQEFKQNLSESLASGGTPTDIITDTLAGLVGSLKGPIGLAAGALAGVGAIAFHQLQQRAEEIEEVVQGVRDVIQAEFDLIDGYIDQATQDRQIADWISEHGEFLADNKDILDALGISVGEYAAGILLGGEHLDAVNDKIAESQEGQSAIGLVIDNNILKYDAVTGLVAQANTEHQRGNDLLTVQREAMDGVYEATDRASGAAQRMQERFDNIATSIRNMPDVDIQGRIRWYNTGPGAAYVDPGNAAYSPGHVAISNLYVGN